MKKYCSMDDRTGHKEGSIVELSIDELNVLPFNVKMKLLDSGIDHREKDKLEKKNNREELLSKLLKAGLSSKRAGRVVEKYASHAELMLNIASAGIDPLTDKWIASEYDVKTVNEIYSKTDIKDKNKAEQVSILNKMGVKEIPKLEDDRVELILKLQGDKK